MDRLLIPCDCGEPAYLDFQVFHYADEGSYYSVCLTQRPARLRYRLKEAWRALVGKEYSVSGELVIGKKELKEIKKFLDLKREGEKEDL